MKSLVWQKRVRQLDGNKKEQEEEGLHCMRSYPGHSTLYWQRHILVGDLDSHCRFEEATSCGTGGAGHEILSRILKIPS
jgi:hypothetical protein